MGSFKDYINRNNTTATNKTSSSSSFMEYHNKRQKEREEEEERKRVAQEKQKNNTVSSTNNTSNFTSKINTSNIEDFQKEYDKLPTAEKTKIAKEIQEETNNSMGKLGLTQNTLNTAPLTNLDEDKLTEVGSLKEKVNNLKTDASSILKNLDLSVENAILQGQKMFNVAMDKVLNDKNKLMLENAKTLSKISGDDSYNSFMDSSVSRLLTQEVDSTKGIQSTINNNNTRIQNNTDKTTNKVSEKLSEITGGAGTTIVGGALSIANPALGTAFFTTSAAGGYYDEALERGMDKDEAQVYAGIMGCMEGVTESVISAERIKGAKSILEGTGFKNAVKSFGLEVGENFLQEAVMPSISEGTALLTGGKESLKYDLSTLEGVKELLKDSLNDGIDGALSAILLGGVTRGSAKCIQVVTNLNNGLKPSKIQVEQAVREAEKSGVNTKEILKNEIVYQAEKNIDNTNNINNQNTQALQQQNTAPIENIIEQNNTILPKARDSFLETAKQYNIDTNNETIQSINRIMNERGINASFNSELFTDNSQNAIWKISKDENGEVTREVVLNPNSDSKKTLQNIVTHELIHDLEGTAEHNELRDLILKYDKKQINYEDARKSLENIYSKVYDPNSSDFQTLVENEAIADILGNKLGDQEFINNLTMKKPSLGRKIYNWVVDKLNKLTGYSNEKLFWQDVKNKFENAYRQDYQNNNNDIKYSKEVLSDGTKYIKLDNKLFQNQDGTLKTAREAYNTLVGKTLNLDDGTEVKILKSLPKKDLYNELSKRRPRSKNVENISEMNNKINGNLDESIESSSLINTRPDVNSRHIEQGIKNFDTREVYLFDGTGAYRLTLSIAELQSGEKVAYAKKNLTYDKQLTEKIKNELSPSSTSNNGRSSRMITPNNSIASSNENVNTIKYSIQESENNTELSEEAKKQLHRYVYMDTKQLNKAFSEAVDNKENMLMEYNALQKEYKEFQNTEEFKNALNDFVRSESPKQETTKIMNKANKYAEKLRYYNNAYETYKAQQDAINSLLMGNETDVRSAKQIVRDAEKHFGITNNFKETAYIDINGNQIDFSGKHEGGPSGARTLDHRQINEIDIDMDSFIDMGNIRILPEGGGINLKIEPNAKQYNKLHEYIDSVDGEIYIDIDKTKNTYDSAEYKKGTPTSKILSDLQYYFKNGKFPHKSEFADFRYSQNNQIWQSYLDKNYKNTGKGQTIQELKLTTANNNVAPSVANNVAETGEWTKRQKNQTKKYTRKEVRNRLFQEMQISPEELSIGDDIKAINYQVTDPVRVNEKVFGKELGDKINNATINKTKHNTAEKIRWQNKERQEIQELGIKARSKESAAVQRYGEKQWVDNNGNIHKYGDTELATEFPNTETQNKIKNAAQVIRNKYDLYIDQINDTLTQLGYNPIPKRKDYMRHFQELGDVFSQTGVPFNLNDLSSEDLPTDINGLTEFNKPGKNWFASSQKRYGNKTTYDAITGIDGYLEGAGNLIFHTEDVQNYRALSEAVRNQFGQTKGFENLEGLTDEQIKQRIEDIQNNKLSKYVAWLDEQANALAGKKGAIDRGVERAIGRRGYTVLNTLKKQVGSNMTGFNVRSSLTNFISSTIASAKTNKIALAKGTISTINNMFHNDGFIEKSDFLTSRFGSNSLSAKTWQKISNAGQIFMTGSDYFTSNLIARSKYYEGLQKGMTEQEALRYSNDFSSRVMGDRSQGATPEAFNSKTLGLFTQFQLEVNNQWQYMIHDTKMDYQQNMKKNGGLKAGATALFQMGQLAAYSYFFNELFEKVTGSRAAFDPIEIFKVLFGIDDDDDDEKSFGERIEEAKDMLIENLPFVSILNGGRIPISEALPIKELLTGKDEYGNEKSRLSTIKETAPYWFLPTGYSQINKTVKGLKTVINNGDYKINSEGEKELRFPVENKNAGTYIKAGLFGKYSLPTAQEYIDNNFKKLSAKQTTTYEESNIPYNEYLQYLNQGLSSTKDKINYIENTDWTESQKWSIYKNDVLSNIERKDGSSQASDAEYITTHGVGKTEYMKLYNKAQENNIDMPTKEEYINLKNSGVSLENYIDYNVKVKETTNELKENGKLTDTQTLKEKDKIEILINSNYSSKETQGIYEACILSSNDKKYSIIKSTNMDITQYLQYKLADSNDELNSKQKVWNYIENMNITYTQKLLLYGLEYTPSDSQQQQIINYVKSLPNKTNKEKLEILSQFKGFTIYEDGAVKY